MHTLHGKENNMLKKIVIIGPESTGKSTLSKDLADKYNTYWVPEYAREYLLTYGPKYDYNDLKKITEGQLKIEDEIAQKAISDHKKFIFIDTNMEVIRTWSEFVFNRCESRVLNEIVNRSYDYYLLCNTDLPWVKDELREYPDERTRVRLYHHYKDSMINQHVPWSVIWGNNENRLAVAVSELEKNLFN